MPATPGKAKEIVRTGARLARPTWATKIEKLRSRLGLNQTDFANRLKVSAMAVSRWERGVNQPPAECYIEMGKMAGPPDCWFFWQCVGLTRADINRCRR